jgi:sulfonate transport system substrate-binding protein
MAAELGLDFQVMRRVIGRKGYGVELIGQEVLTEQQEVADTFLQLGLIPTAIDVREAALPKSFDAEAVQLAKDAQGERP